MIVSYIVFLLLFIISAGPALAGYYYLSRTNYPDIIKASFLGFGSWFLAQLLLMLPIVAVRELVLRRGGFNTAELANNTELQNQAANYLMSNWAYILFLAVAYALTNQLVRFAVIERAESVKRSAIAGTAFALGWVLGYIALVYSLTLVLALVSNPAELVFDAVLFAGAYEKALTTILVVFLTMLVWLSIKQKNVAFLIEAANWELAYFSIPFLIGNVVLPSTIPDNGRILIVELLFTSIIIAMLVLRSQLIKEFLNEMQGESQITIGE